MACQRPIPLYPSMFSSANLAYSDREDCVLSCAQSAIDIVCLFLHEFDRPETANSSMYALFPYVDRLARCVDSFKKVAVRPIAGSPPFSPSCACATAASPPTIGNWYVPSVHSVSSSFPLPHAHFHSGVSSNMHASVQQGRHFSASAPSALPTQLPSYGPRLYIGFPSSYVPSPLSQPAPVRHSRSTRCPGG